MGQPPARPLASSPQAVTWGRSVYDNVQKFLQFQLTVNVVALALTFFAAVLQYEPPLNPVEMLWLNLIMDTMGALALVRRFLRASRTALLRPLLPQSGALQGTEPPSDALLARLPYSSTAGLISPRMWRHIFVQAAFQFAMLITLLLAGPGLLGVDDEFLVRVGGLCCPGIFYFVCLSRSASASAVAGKSSTLSGPNSYGGSTDIARYMSTFIFNAFVFSQVCEGVATAMPSRRLVALRMLDAYPGSADLQRVERPLAHGRVERLYSPQRLRALSHDHPHRGRPAGGARGTRWPFSSDDRPHCDALGHLHPSRGALGATRGGDAGNSRPVAPS